MFTIGNISANNKDRGARLGDYKAYCDRTGFRVFASDCKMQWDGLFVRKESWEIRQPQDFIKAKPEHLAVPIPRPFTGPEPTVDDSPINIF